MANIFSNILNSLTKNTSSKSSSSNNVSSVIQKYTGVSSAAANNAAKNYTSNTSAKTTTTSTPKTTTTTTAKTTTTTPKTTTTTVSTPKATTTSTAKTTTTPSVASIVQQYGGVSSAAANNVANNVAKNTGSTATTTTPKATTTTVSGLANTANISSAAAQNIINNTNKANTASTTNSIVAPVYTQTSNTSGILADIPKSNYTIGQAPTYTKVDNTPDLSTMTQAQKNAELEKRNIPLVYSDDVAQQIINNMDNAGISDFKQYNDTASLMSGLNGTKFGVGPTVDEIGNQVRTEAEMLQYVQDRIDQMNEEGSNEDYNNGLNGSNGTNKETNTQAAVEAYESAQAVYNDLMAAFMEKNDAARQAAIDAILANLESVKGTYKSQIQKIIDEYQSLINENEVNRERTRRRIRENQANRGQLDSGMGRQERLNLDTTYDTNQANLNSARESAVNEIYNLIAQAESEANTNKATVENNYANALLQWQLANQ